MIDFIAGGIDLVASYTIGNKRRYGFILQFLGNLVWVFVAFKTRLFGLLLVVLPALVMNVRNYFRWRKES